MRFFLNFLKGIKKAWVVVYYKILLKLRKLKDYVVYVKYRIVGVCSKLVNTFIFIENKVDNFLRGIENKVDNFLKGIKKAWVVVYYKILLKLRKLKDYVDAVKALIEVLFFSK